MKKAIICFVLVCTIGCGHLVGYSIDQEVTKYLDLGYNVDTRIWKDGKIVWSHYTFQEWRTELNRIYIPLDSIPSVKKRDYETAQRILKILKENNFKP